MLAVMKSLITRARAVDVTDWIGASWSVIELISTTITGLETLCRANGMSVDRFYRTLADNQELRDNYRVARKIRAQLLADEALRVTAPTDDDHALDAHGRYTGNTGRIQRDALRAKVLLELAAKHDPETYGDRVITDVRDSRVVLTIGDPTAAAEKYRQRQLNNQSEK